MLKLGKFGLFLRIMEFAIVDIETTGGFGANNKITEIAIIIHDGEKELDRYVTLVNPNAFISQQISALTGITNYMVEEAPQFFEVAKKVWEFTEGRIFVAHNVSFDYNVIRNEFKDIGAQFKRKKLCTVRLAKKVFPGKSSYSLGNLCESLSIPLQNRHRALGDTEATVLLFKKMIQENGLEELNKELERLNKETKLPPKLDAECFNRLPESCGVYYMYNEAKEVIYIGKAKNIKKRINQHFTTLDSSSKKNNMMLEIADISYELTGSELIALLMESEEIKLNSPKYNKAQKKISFNVGIIQYKDQNGYNRLAIEKKAKAGTPSFLRFSTQSEARSFIQELTSKGKLCQKLTGLQSVNDSCFEYQLNLCKGACVKQESAHEYNSRLKYFLDNVAFDGDSFFVKDIGRDIDEYSIAWIQNGKYKGFGFFNYHVDDLETIKEGIKPAMDNRDVLKIIKSYVSKAKLEVIELENDSSSGGSETLTLF